MSVLVSPLPTLPALPSTRLGDLARQTHRTPKWRALIGKIVRLLAVAIIAVTGIMAVTSATAGAWIVDDTVSQIQNFCRPNDVSVPSTAFSGLDSLFGLNTFEKAQSAQGTVLPNEKGQYADYSKIAPTYQRYGFSALTVRAYGTGCGTGLIAMMMPIVFNLASTLFIHVPVALTMLGVQLALSGIFSQFIAILLSPFFKMMSQIMVPFVSILAPFGLIYVFFKYKGQLSKFLTAFIYSAVCVGLVFYGARSDSSLRTYTKTADALVTKSTSIVVTQIASTAFPTVASDGKGGFTAVNGATGSSGGKDAATAINNALWKGIPLATWTTVQMGAEMADSAWGGGNATSAGLTPSQWQARLLNANHIGVVNKAGAADNSGKTLLAGIDAWNARSYQVNGDDTKTDAWTEGFDEEVDSGFASGYQVYKAVPTLADAGLLCGDKMEISSDGSGEAENNKWMYNGSCTPPDELSAAWRPYFQGLRWIEGPYAIMSGALGALLVLHLVGLIAFYLAIQKALMYWLLMFAPVFVGIASFGDEKRRGFARAYAGELFANVMKQVMAVASLVIVSYMVSAIIVAKNIPFVIKPTMVFIMGSSLLLLYFIARKIAKAAIAGDTSIVHKTAKAPVTAAKAAAVVAAVAAAPVAAPALAGAASSAGLPGLAKAATALGDMGTKGMLKAGGSMAKNVLQSPTARRAAARTLSHTKAGRIANKVLALNDMAAHALNETNGQGFRANDPIGNLAKNWGNGGGRHAAGQGAAGVNGPSPVGAPGAPGAPGTQPNGRPDGQRDPNIPANANLAQVPNIHPARAAMATAAPGSEADIKANGQASYNPPVGGATAGNLPDGAPVVSASNQAQVQNLSSQIIQREAMALAGDTGMSMEQAQAVVTANMASAPVGALNGLNVDVSPQSVSAENMVAAVQMTGGNLADLPAAVQTIQVAEAGKANLAAMMETKTMEIGQLRTQIQGRTIEGEDLLSRMNSSPNVTEPITVAGAIADPVEFVAQAQMSGVYGDGGSLANLDHRHGAANELMVAIGAVQQGLPEEDIATAFAGLSQAIQQYGIPSVVTGAHAVEGSELAARSLETLTEASAMAASFKPDAGAEWGTYAQNMSVMYQSLSQEYQDSPVGEALHLVAETASNPYSTIDDIRNANATLVMASNTVGVRDFKPRETHKDLSEFLNAALDIGAISEDEIDVDLIDGYQDPTGDAQAAINELREQRKRAKKAKKDAESTSQGGFADL